MSYRDIQLIRISIGDEIADREAALKIIDRRRNRAHDFPMMAGLRPISLLLLMTLASSTGCGHSADAPTAPTGAGAPGVPGTQAGALPVVTLVEVSKQLTMTSRNYVGQSVTIPAGAAVSDIRFNWYTYKNGGDQAARNQTATAFGALYVLSQEYLGLPAGLSASTPGYVGKSAYAADGQYFFGSAVTLAGGKRYWFYTDAGGSFVTSFNVSSYAGGDMYITGQTDPVFPVLPFRKAPASWLLQPDGGYLIPPPGTFVDADFRLQGSVGGS